MSATLVEVVREAAMFGLLGLAGFSFAYMTVDLLERGREG